MARSIRRLTGIAGIALAGLVILMLAGVAAFVLLVDADVFRPRIERLATAQLGREVTLGRLHWDLGWRIGVSTENGAVASPPGFAQPLATWRRISLGLALRPLLRRQVALDHIEAQGLVLELERNAAGVANWALAPRATTGDARTRVDIGSVRLEDAQVRYRDAVAGAQWQVEGLQFECDIEPGHSALPQALNDLELRGRVRGGPLAPTGVAVQLAADRLTLDADTLRIEARSFDLKLDDAHLQGSLVAQAGETPQAEGAIQLEMPSLRALLAGFGVVPGPMRDPDTLGAMSLATTLRYRDDSLILSPLTLRLDDTRLTGNVQLPTLSPPALRFELEADQVNLDRYLEPTDFEGDPLELPEAQLKALDAQGVLRIREARVAGATARGVMLRVE